MNKEKVLIILVCILLILNAVLIGMFFKQKRAPRGHQRVEQLSSDQKDAQLKKHFDFDDRQMEIFVKSKQHHGGAVIPLKEELEELSKHYYHLDDSEVNRQKRDSLLLEIGRINKNIYQTNLEHFDDIRNLCNAQQLEKLDRFIDNLLSQHQGNPNHKNRQPRERRSKR